MKLIVNNQEPNLKIPEKNRFLKILNRVADYITEDYPEAAEQELGICFMDQASMTALNESFVNHEGPTDVITFDFRDEYNIYEDEEVSAGEIYVCPAVAADRAAEFNNDFDSELMLYIIHGFLHLFGYDDKTDEDQTDMTHAENRSMTWVKAEDTLEGVFYYNG